jgi:hypothetical protein
MSFLNPFKAPKLPKAPKAIPEGDDLRDAELEKRKKKIAGRKGRSSQIQGGLLGSRGSSSETTGLLG